MICILNKPYFLELEIFLPPKAAWVVPWGTTQLCREFAQVQKNATTTYWKTYFWILRSCRHPDHSAIALYHTTERFGASGVLLSLNFGASASIFSSSGKGDHFWPAEGACQRGCSGLEKVEGVRWFDCPAKKTTSANIIIIVITTTIIRVGVSVGDRVAGYIPNCPEAIIAMAATASLGSPDHDHHNRQDNRWHPFDFQEPCGVQLRQTLGSLVFSTASRRLNQK